jgi:hypothetical protein
MLPRVILCLLPLVLSSCAGPPVIAGRYASRLSAEDIQQITLLVEARRDIHKPILKIDVFHPDRADVETRQRFASQLRAHFTVTKRRGKWNVDEGSIEYERIITVE